MPVNGRRDLIRRLKFNLLYAAPGDRMGAVLLIQILRVTLIPTVARTAVHLPTM